MKKKGINAPPAGRKLLIDEVIERLEPYCNNLPITSFKFIESMAGVCSRTLERYFKQGLEEYEKLFPESVEELPVDTKNLSPFIRFYLLVKTGREKAYLKAVTVVMGALNKNDVKSARKYLATVDPEHWAETKKIEHSTGGTGNRLYEAFVKLREEYKKKVGQDDPK